MNPRERKLLKQINGIKDEKQRNDIQRMGAHLIFIKARARGKKESINCIKYLYETGQLELIKDWDYFHPEEKELIKNLLSKKDKKSR